MDPLYATVFSLSLEELKMDWLECKAKLVAFWQYLLVADRQGELWLFGWVHDGARMRLLAVSDDGHHWRAERMHWNSCCWLDFLVVACTRTESNIEQMLMAAQSLEEQCDRRFQELLLARPRSYILVHHLSEVGTFFFPLSIPLSSCGLVQKYSFSTAIPIQCVFIGISCHFLHVPATWGFVFSLFRHWLNTYFDWCIWRDILFHIIYLSWNECMCFCCDWLFV